MKKLIILFGVIAFIGLASAITVSLGQSVTQQQLDAFNVSSVDLECVHDNTTLEYNGETLISANFHCFSLKKEGGNYTVVQKYYSATYPLRKYILCRVTDSKTDCLDEKVNPALKDQVIAQKQDIRTEIEDWQTQTGDLILHKDIDLGDI